MVDFTTDEVFLFLQNAWGSATYTQYIANRKCHHLKYGPLAMHVCMYV